MSSLVRYSTTRLFIIIPSLPSSLCGHHITSMPPSPLQVENHLHDMILKTFDPKKADAIFAEEGETPSWLAELIEYPTWRSLIYRLAEDYPGMFYLTSEYV